MFPYLFDILRTEFHVEDKLDASPVTIADRQAEEAMRQLIKQAMPHHSIFGEEHGLELGVRTAPGQSPEFLWVLDPIDGTKSFITGVDLAKCNCCLGLLFLLLTPGFELLAGQLWQNS